MIKKTIAFISTILIPVMIYGQLERIDTTNGVTREIYNLDKNGLKQDDFKTNQAARFGVNRAFFGSGDIIGPAIYGEYSYSLNNYFAITPRIMSAYAHRKSEGYFDHASSFATSLSIRLTPLPNLFQRLKVDFGGLYHKFICTYGEIGQKTDYEEYISPRTLYYKEELFGLIGSLNVNIIDTKKIETGLRFDMLTSFTEGYFNCDSWQTGIYIGLKF